MDTTFPDRRDHRFWTTMVAESAERFFPRLQYLRLLESPFIDELHQEVHNENKVFADPILIHGYVVPAGQVNPLTQFGMEKLRDTTLVICTSHLLKAGLATENADTGEIRLVASEGDRFIWSDGVVYDILNWLKGPGWANSDIPMFWEAKAVQFQPDADAYSEV